jgi:hypothetical protein
MQQALGGADKIAAIRDFDETVSAQTFNAQGASAGATVLQTTALDPTQYFAA